MTLSKIESALIAKYKGKIVPVEDGYTETMDFLREHFTLVKRKLDQNQKHIYTGTLKQLFPNETNLPVLKAVGVLRDQRSEPYFHFGTLPGPNPNEILVVLAEKYGCIDCSSSRLKLELNLRKTITLEDIEQNSDVLRYRVFCLSELDRIDR